MTWSALGVLASKASALSPVPTCWWMEASPAGDPSRLAAGVTNHRLTRRLPVVLFSLRFGQLSGPSSAAERLAHNRLVPARIRWAHPKALWLARRHTHTHICSLYTEVRHRAASMRIALLILLLERLPGCQPHSFYYRGGTWGS